MCAAMAAAGHEEADGWELVNDEGFVYRRKKRQRLDPTVTSSSFEAPVEERRNRIQLRKRVLEKLRDKHQIEINHWELLSNTLRELEQNAKLQSQELNCGDPSLPERQPALEPHRSTIVEDLLTQVETQEAIIQEVCKLCDIAEGLCSAQEERRKQELVNLPIWDPSPQDLLTVLGES